MKLIAHAYLAKSAIEGESPRMCRLAWVLVNSDNTPIRGRDALIDPLGWEMTEEGAIIEGGGSFNKLFAAGQKVEDVLKRFIYDYENANELYAKDAEQFVSILITEAKMLNLSASKRPSQRHSLPKECENIDLSSGIMPLLKAFSLSDKAE